MCQSKNWWWSLPLIAITIGCGPANWQISAENQSATPVQVTVAMGGGERKAEVLSLTPGPPQVLIAEPNVMHIQSVTVVQADTRQILKPLIDLKPGQHYAIVIAPDGKATAAVK